MRAAHAWAAGFWSFGLARAVLGAGEGATFPGGLRTVTQTLPPAKRGRGLAIAYSCALIVLMLAVILLIQLAVGERRLGRRTAQVLGVRA